MAAAPQQPAGYRVVYFTAYHGLKQPLPEASKHLVKCGSGDYDNTTYSSWHPMTDNTFYHVVEPMFATFERAYHELQKIKALHKGQEPFFGKIEALYFE